MNPIKFGKVKARLQDHQASRLAYHNEQINELKSRGLFDFYIDRLSNGAIELVDGYDRDYSKSYSIYLNEEEAVRKELLSLTFSKEYVEVKLVNISEIDEPLSDIQFFLAYRLFRYSVGLQTPTIHIHYPSSQVDKLIPYLSHEGYSVTYKPTYDGSKYVDITIIHEEQLVAPLTNDDVLKKLNEVFGESYTFQFDGRHFRTPASQSHMSISNEPSNQIHLSSLTKDSKDALTELFPKSVRSSSHFFKVALSLDEQKRSEEIECLSLLLFSELLEPVESIMNLSKELRERIERYFLNRFNDIRKLPEQHDSSWNGKGIHSELIDHFLSGSWKETDNYRSKLFQWFENLTVCQANTFGFICHYNGSVNGLEQEAYILFPYDSFRVSVDSHKIKHVYSSLEEATIELNRFNERVIELWNKRK
ncbi:hypothetical protein [Rossellomorea marisflavi]|uniref:hypothetical protein n=1 Tax=Rossellomorea marisflavi TaxID=189381 RepID=UPI003FA001A2